MSDYTGDGGHVTTVPGRGGRCLPCQRRGDVTTVPVRGREYRAGVRGGRDYRTSERDGDASTVPVRGVATRALCRGKGWGRDRCAGERGGDANTAPVNGGNCVLAQVGTWHLVSTKATKNNRSLIFITVFYTYTHLCVTAYLSSPQALGLRKKSPSYRPRWMRAG